MQARTGLGQAVINVLLARLGWLLLFGMALGTLAQHTALTQLGARQPHEVRCLLVSHAHCLLACLPAFAAAFACVYGLVEGTGKYIGLGICAGLCIAFSLAIHVACTQHDRPKYRVPLFPYIPAVRGDASGVQLHSRTPCGRLQLDVPSHAVQLL